MKDKLNSLKKNVVEHKTAYVVGAVAAIAIVAQHHALMSHNDFLKENDLYDEYYKDEE